MIRACKESAKGAGRRGLNKSTHPNPPPTAPSPAPPPDHWRRPAVHQPHPHLARHQGEVLQRPAPQGSKRGEGKGVRQPGTAPHALGYCQQQHVGRAGPASARSAATGARRADFLSPLTASRERAGPGFVRVRLEPPELPAGLATRLDRLARGAALLLSAQLNPLTEECFPPFPRPTGQPDRDRHGEHQGRANGQGGGLGRADQPQVRNAQGRLGADKEPATHHLRRFSIAGRVLLEDATKA
jgi:hypothetical protein